MHILLTNDDGIEARGLHVLAAAVGPEVRITVVAPDQGYSGCGHQVTNDTAIRVERLSEQRYKVFGTPADCTRLAISELAPDVDWVLCGVNAGANLGVDLVMSGTVAAAREATWLGKRAIAFSQYIHRDQPRDWDRTQRMTTRTFQELMQRELAADRFWNVNLPDEACDDSQVAIVDTFPEPRHLSVGYRVDKHHYQFQSDYRNRSRTPGSDVDVCFGGAISVSCISAVG